MVLLLSHGQATVERGFSVNRQVDDDNLHADTFCCRRLICDTVAYDCGIYAIDTSNKALLLSCSSDQLAEKAESSRDMSILVKSNAVCEACKEKTAEMTELDKQLADKLLE